MYVTSISELMQYVCYPLQISTAVKSSNILRQSLVQVKSCIPTERKNNCVIYEIPVQTCVAIQRNEPEKSCGNAGLPLGFVLSLLWAGLAFHQIGFELDQLWAGLAFRWVGFVQGWLLG